MEEILRLQAETAEQDNQSSDLLITAGSANFTHCK
jgi:hypothetical protein